MTSILKAENINKAEEEKKEDLNKVKSKKQTLGQFMTTKYKYILQNMQIPKYVKNIIEPFAGNCDLLNFIENKELYNIECYDIDIKNNYTIKQDTLANPPIYTDKFILTNPPYLARNKSKSKEIFDKYDTNDLYKCFILEIIKNHCLGGIIIIPINFWSSIRQSDKDLRKSFLSIYNINQLNIFEEKVFNDTTTSVSCCLFELITDINIKLPEIKTTIYPSRKNIELILNDDNDYSIGGHLYKLPTTNSYTITRITSKNKTKKLSNILVKCIDDNKDNLISLSIVSDKDIYIDETEKLSARTYASLIIEPYIDIDLQKKLIIKVNNFLKVNRVKYNSLFLTNYRESSDIARKRISFDLIYKLTKYILEYKMNED